MLCTNLAWLIFPEYTPDFANSPSVSVGEQMSGQKSARRL